VKRLWILTLVVTLAGWGCKTDEHVEKDDPVPGPVVTAPDQADGSATTGTEETSSSASSGDEDGGGSVPVAEEKVEGSTTGARKVRVRSSVSGCLSQSRGQEQPEAPSRARGAPDRFVVTGQKGNVAVEQSFSHACCLESRTSATLEGSTVVVTTELMGTPCRCMCASTIRSAVSLPPGTYTVRIVHRQGENVRERHVERATVR